MINLRIQLFAMLFAASVTAALHASVFSVLGYNEQALPTGDVGGEFKRVAVNISVRNTPTENSKLVDKLMQPTNDVVQPKITKMVKKPPQESMDKPKLATIETLSIVKSKPTKPVVKKVLSESIPTTNVKPELELKPDQKPEPEQKPVIQPQIQTQASSESPTLNDVVQPKITKMVKKPPQESMDKPKLATIETLSIVKSKPTKPVVKKVLSESIPTTNVKPELELKPDQKPEPEQKPVIQPQIQTQASSESPTLNEGLIKQESRVSEAYKLALVKRLAAKKNYPIKARLAGIEGTANTRFSVDADGDLFDFELVSSSGSAYLDKAVKKTFEKAFPLPSFITKLGSGQIQIFTLPIHFKIK